MATQPDPAGTAKPAAAGHWGKDLVAGLINGVVSIPDGLAAGALAGVNPVAGLYTSAFAPMSGSLLTSAQRMQIATTGASALAAGEAIRAFPPALQGDALLVLTVTTGLFLGLFALLRVGKLVKYVSHAVMTSFMIGVAVVLIMDQLAPLVGYDPPPGSEPYQFWSLLKSLDAISWQALTIGGSALILAAVLNRTRLRSWSSLFAMVVPTLAVLLVGWTSIVLVSDESVVAGGLPMPRLPSVRLLDPELLLAAFALAAIIMIQGAGVSQSMRNLDGKPISVNQDILAQGVGNVAAGIFSGIPCGGSIGQSALNVSIGAQTRWSGIFGGIWILAILLLFATPVGYVPMTVLAALMILAGISAIDLKEARAIWVVGWPSRLAALATFGASLFFSITVAIMVGVALSALMSIVGAANDVRVVWLKENSGGDLIEESVPRVLDEEAEVMVINVYGSLFFAGARTLRERLPRVSGASRPIVVLRLRGYSRVGATLVDVLDEYAEELAGGDGRLYVSGLEPKLLEPLRSISKLTDDDDLRLYSATNLVGESTRAAVADAKAWRTAPTGSPRGN